jgi:hypothetical protein
LKERKKNEVPSIMIGGTITGWPGVPQDLWWWGRSWPLGQDLAWKLT